MAEVLEQIPYVQYTANGATTVFAYAFEVPTASDMVVYADGVLVPASAYTLAGVGVQAGGTVTFLVAPVNGTRVLLNREIALQRTTSYQTLGDFRAAVVNPDFNRLWMALQGQSAAIGSTVRAPYPEQFAELPDPAGRANNLLGWDSAGAMVMYASALATGVINTAGVFINPTSAPYNAIGDGVTDATAAFNAALLAARAANGVVIVPPGLFSIGVVDVENGVRGILGFGGTLKLRNVVNSGLRLRGQKSGRATDVSNCTIQGLRIDCNNNANSTVPIWGENIFDCKILDNVIVNVAFGWGILLLNYTVTTPAGGGNKIQRNKVFGTSQTNPAVSNWFGIGCYAEEITTTTPPDGSVAPATDQWRKLFTGPSAQQYQAGNVITDNRVSGGYYAFFLHGLVDSVVSNNNMNSNTRGISLQNRANRNVVSNNYILENYSAGIHLAFGSCDNIIDGNSIYTSIGLGEALIQAYIGCQRNTISNNKLSSNEGSVGQQHGIYCAVHASDNTISGNDIAGRYKLAYIGIASAWDAAATETFRYAKNGDGSHIDWMANAPTTGVVISGNTIRRGAFNIPAILLDQGTTHAGATYTGPGGIQSTWDSGYTAAYAAALTGTVVRDNTIVGSIGVESLRLYETTASNLNTAKMIGNSWDMPAGAITESTAATYFVLPRGRAHFLHTEANFPFDANAAAFSMAASATPSVAIGKHFAAANGSNVNITSLLNGIDEQEVLIRLDVFTGITHTAGGGADTIRLARGYSIPAGTETADSWLTLRRQSGVWFEMARSLARSRAPVQVNAAATSIVAGASTKVTWTEIVDDNSEWASDTFTCKVPGVYTIAARVVGTGGVTFDINENFELRVYINGAQTYNGMSAEAQLTYGGNKVTAISVTRNLAVGDTVEFYVFHNGNANQSLNGVAAANWAQITYIG